MLAFLPSTLRGVIAATLLTLNSLFWSLLVFAFALVKLGLPFTPVRSVIDPILNAFAANWISCNALWMRLTQRTEWDVELPADLHLDGWYLVSANHQSWVDIFVLQRLLNRRIPMLKFFLKQELIWVPVMGLAWWALDLPFMRRHSDAYLRRHPEKRFEDLETTRRACRKFALVPTSVMNFPEGTRFTSAKHREQKSPYGHLLKPRAGAMALALSVLGDRFRSMLDVTIVYPHGIPSFWDFLCGRVPAIIVRMRTVEIPAEFGTADYATDKRFRKSFQRWLASLWRQKDLEIAQLLGEPGPEATTASSEIATTDASLAEATSVTNTASASPPGSLR